MDLSSLAYALMQQRAATPPAPNVTPAVPLSSMIDRLAPNGAQLQLQNPQLPWWAVPGMFKAGPPGFAMPQAPAAAPAPAPAQADPTQEDILRRLMQQQIPYAGGEAGGGSGGGVEIAGGGGASW